MEKLAENFFKKLKDSLDNTAASGKDGGKAGVFEALAGCHDMIRKQAGFGKKVIMIGNGGSAGIASHIAVDFWKNGGIRAVAFNDSSLLTCIGNDLGYDRVFSAPLEMFADKGDVLIAISSSGRSKNILNAVEAARKAAAHVITMSGFSPDNPLRKTGNFNFYVPSDGYGCVETVHAALCHVIVDSIIESRNKI